MLVMAMVAAGAHSGCGGEPPSLDVARPSAGAAAQPIASTPAPSPAGPQVVALDPPQGAIDVDPARGFLAVTFDRPMDPQGWSWVVEGPETAPDLGEASFDPDGRTNRVVARMEPGRTYVVWINSSRFQHFQDLAGVPATPLRWTFTTRGDGVPPSAGERSPATTAPLPPAAAPAPPFAPISSRGAPIGVGVPSAAPQVIALSPPNGARNVDPAAVSELRVTFDREMANGWSWVREGDNFPETTGPAGFAADRRTAVLPVRLEPGRQYVVWLNHEPYMMFTDPSGRPADPVRWEFWTTP